METTTEIQPVETILSEILAALKTPQVQNKLWAIEDLCAYFQLSRTTINRSVVCKPSFPVAIRIEGGVPRWKPSEVEQWAEKQREKRPSKH